MARSGRNCTKDDARAFLGHCQWVQRCWCVYCFIRDRTPVSKQGPHSGKQGAEFSAAIMNIPGDKIKRHLVQVHLDYTILQIAKLHDKKPGNLSINFMASDLKGNRQCKDLQAKLETFYNGDYIPKCQPCSGPAAGKNRERCH